MYILVRRGRVAETDYKACQTTTLINSTQTNVLRRQIFFYKSRNAVQIENVYTFYLINLI